MKTCSASQARAHRAEVLDLAEAGRQVAIERGGVRFEIAVVRKPRRSRRERPLFQLLDEAVAGGPWTWDWRTAGLHFARHPRPG